MSCHGGHDLALQHRDVSGRVHHCFVWEEHKIAPAMSWEASPHSHPLLLSVAAERVTSTCYRNRFCHQSSSGSGEAFWLFYKPWNQVSSEEFPAFFWHWGCRDRLLVFISVTFMPGLAVTDLLMVSRCLSMHLSLLLLPLNFNNRSKTLLFGSSLFCLIHLLTF